MRLKNPISLQKLSDDKLVFVFLSEFVTIISAYHLIFRNDMRILSCREKINEKFTLLSFIFLLQKKRRCVIIYKKRDIKSGHTGRGASGALYLQSA